MRLVSVGRRHYYVLPFESEPVMADATEGTSIQMAAGDGLLEVVRAFVAGGNVGPNTKDAAGYSAMHAAVSYGEAAVLRYLLSVGGDVHVTDEDGERRRARCQHGGGARVARRASNLRLRALTTRTLRAPHAAGDTPLHVCETAECARLLLDAGAELTRQDGEGLTPYHIAVHEHRDEMTAFLEGAYAARGLEVPHVEPTEGADDVDEDAVDEEEGGAPGGDDGQGAQEEDGGGAGGGGAGDGEGRLQA